MINLILSVSLLMITNIFLGSLKSNILKEFNKEIFINGVIKCITIIISLVLMLVASYLTKEYSIPIDNRDYTLYEAMKLIFITALGIYGVKCLNNLKDVFKIKSIKTDIKTLPIKIERDDVNEKK